METVQRGEGPPAEVALVTFPAPHGIEAVTLIEGSVVSFGRGIDCEIRFGFAPQPDQEVPRLAGQFAVINRRVFVESAATIGHRAIEVRSDEQAVQVPVGEGYSPRQSHFDVLVRGTASPWKLHVTVRSEPQLHGRHDAIDPPTSHYSLSLTDLQRTVLSSYARPLKNGRMEPATHKDVAGELSYHPNTVREALYEIWAMMFEQGIPMPDISDKRFAVVEAARIHGLLV